MLLQHNTLQAQCHGNTAIDSIGWVHARLECSTEAAGPSMCTSAGPWPGTAATIKEAGQHSLGKLLKYFQRYVVNK